MLDIPLILFAKAPIPGSVKTRLQSHCSEAEAAKIAEVLLEVSIQNALKNWAGTVYLAVWLNQEHEFIQAMLKRYPIKLLTQVAGDLGDKMQAALASQNGPAAVMGCDVPHCPSEVFREAHQKLSFGYNVIGPSKDGGYYLLGLQQANLAIFSQVDWGTAKVYQQTLRNAASLEITFTELISLSDIDEWPDLLEVASLVPELNKLIGP